MKSTKTLKATNKHVNTPLGPNRWDTLEEVQNRLLNGLVLYDNEPYVVSSIQNHRDGVYRLHLNRPGTGQREGRGNIVGYDTNENPIFEKTPPPIIKKINSRHFGNISEFPLGFANIFFKENGRKGNFKYCTFFERAPARRMRQAISQNTCSFYQVDGHYAELLPNNGSNHRQSWPGLIKEQGFVDMCQNNYPSFAETMEALIPDSSIAIDKEYALYQNSYGLITLFHKKEAIGIIRRQEILIIPGKEYEIEAIKENKELFPVSSVSIY